MNNVQSTEKSTTQKELEELKARLKQNSIAMQRASKRADSTDMMAGVIKTIGTFEKS